MNPRNNLAHCFCCKKNLNNIDLLLTLDYDFASAVSLLERWLERYQPGRNPRRRESKIVAQALVALFSHNDRNDRRRAGICRRVALSPRVIVLQNSQQFGNLPFPRPKFIQPLFGNKCVRIWSGTGEPRSGKQVLNAFRHH